MLKINVPQFPDFVASYVVLREIEQRCKRRGSSTVAISPLPPELHCFGIFDIHQTNGFWHWVKMFLHPAIFIVPVFLDTPALEITMIGAKKKHKSLHIPREVSVD
jgi:hypothetical protein